MEPIREADVQTQPGKRLAESPKRQKKNGKTGKIIACAAAAAVVVFYGACCVLAYCHILQCRQLFLRQLDIRMFR